MDELCIRTSGSPLQGELLAGIGTLDEVEVDQVLVRNPRLLG